MLRRIGNCRRVALGWLRRRPAYLFMTADEERLRQEPAERFVGVWPGLIVFSLAWGLISTGLYIASWIVFGDYFGIPLMPVAIVLAVMAGWLYRRCFLALGGVLSGGDGPAAALCVGVALIVLVLAMLGLRGWKHDFSQNLPALLRWLRPPELFRPLILSPLWGGWAMLITPQFCPARQGACPAVAGLKSGCGPLKTSLLLLGLLAVTAHYFNYLPWTQLGISAAAVLGAVGGGAILCRLSGGLDRAALLASNLLAQIVFLLAYLANR